MSQDDTTQHSTPIKPEPSLPFNLMGHELEDGFTLVEASAGTGKTYSITWLVTRLILERALEVSELLVVTFTIAATEEMKSRIRAHLADCLARWPEVERVAALHAQGGSSEGSSAPAELLTIYERLSEEGRALASRRLQRAVDRFEEAQISTIHGFCSQALKEHSAELDLDLGRVQTHLLPLFDEVIDDYRSLVFSQSSLQSLRLMESLKKNLNLDRSKSLMPVIRKLEVGGWGAVLCDPLTLPPREGEQGEGEGEGRDPLAGLIKRAQEAQEAQEAQASALEGAEGGEELPQASTERAPTEAELALERLRELTLNPSDLTPRDVINAWGEVALHFTRTLITGPLNTLTDPAQHSSLREALSAMNEVAKWNKGAGPDAQEVGWGALAQLNAKLQEARSGALSPSRLILPDEDLPPEAELLTSLIALQGELNTLSNAGIVGGLSKNAKKINGEFFGFSHPLALAIDELGEALDASASVMRSWFRVGFVRYCERELPARKAQQGLLSTDDLIHFTRHALKLEGSSLKRSLTQRFKAALLDEFQDTDPAQWEVFDLVFGEGHAPVYLIGDPKQSIYRFRGADLNAYLAVKERTPARRRFTMSRNFRTDPRLLNVLNQLFDPRTSRLLPQHLELAPPGTESEDSGFFGDPRIPYIHVDGGRPDRLEGEPALVVSYMPNELKVKPNEDLPERVAADICAYLRRGVQVWPKGVGVGEPREVRVSDIGVLTGTNMRANLIAGALARRGIPSNVRNDDSVFKTHSALELERLLRGLLMPHDDDTLRTALSVDALAMTAQEVRLATDSARDVFTELHRVWQDQGLAPAFQRLLDHPELNLVERVLEQPNGAQTLTHLTHLVEIAQGYARANALSPELTLQWLRERRLEEDAEVEESDKVRPHIDGEAVEVVTIHRSKGLEYPILFCPDLWVAGNESFEGKDFATVLEPERAGDPRSLDLRLLDESPPEPTRSQALLLVQESLRRERLRLLYVALTRPLHQLHLYLSIPGKNFYPHPLQQMITGPSLQYPSRLKRDELEGMLLELLPERVAESEGQARLVITEEHISTQSWTDPNAHERPLAVHEPVNSTSPSWRATSFSALSKVVRAAQQDKLSLEERPEVDEEAVSEAVAISHYEGPTPPLLRLPQQARNARFGLCLHSLFEQLDFATCDPQEVREQAREALTVWGLPWAWTEDLAEGVWAALHTPLSGGGEGAILRQITRAARRDEVSFELALGERPLRAPLLNELIRLDPACVHLPPFPDDFSLSGYLKGSIDLLFRHPTHQTADGLGRYVIVDYKSNWLGERVERSQGGQHDEPEGPQAPLSTLAHYHPRALEKVMREHLYLLQSLLYLVALHRLLKERLGERYDYNTHCGGALYLFARGMAGAESLLPAQPGEPREVAGVFVHQPPKHVIELLDLALDDSARAEQALYQHTQRVGF